MALEGYELMEAVYRKVPPLPEPPFSDPENLTAIWGKNWGFATDVGKLKSVLVHNPGDEFNIIKESGYDPEIDALIGEDSEYYWVGRKAPDLEKVKEQHANLVKILEDEGVEVVYLTPALPNLCKSVFTRDPGIMIPGGAVIGRMGPKMRRGEERSFTQTLAALGVPILATIHGTGLLEGGSFAYINEHHAVVGQGTRVNEKAIHQLRNILDVQDINLIVVPLPGNHIHIDGSFCMVDVKTALVHADVLPYWFMETLRSLEVKTINVHPTEFWGINSLAVRPGRVILSQGTDRTAERLDKAGIEVIQVDVSEIQKGGGGVHCSTFPLIREPV